MPADPVGPALKSIVIVGGGTAGWMTAALFSNVFKGKYRITLVESEEIGIVGVGEATIPAIKTFNAALDLQEYDVLKATQGTYKLGIEFVNWRKKDHSYIHGFGKIGKDVMWLKAHQYWLKMFPKGGLKPFDHYSINAVAMMHNRYSHVREDMENSPLQHMFSAYHFDASLYAQFLRKYAQARGVIRQEGRIDSVKLRDSDGFIDRLIMQNGSQIQGDLFVDCSGMAALLIEKALGVSYEDWSHWLFCDRAIAVPCASMEPLPPYTRSTAHGAGWQWRIPLQHRIGNGHVYSSQFMGEDEATSILLNNLDGAQLAEPRHIKFKPGRRRVAWKKNCVAIGLSGGFIEPLESTSIHMIQNAITRLVHLFPDMSFDTRDIAEYNRRSKVEYEDIRDFIITHYKVTERNDTRFWRECQQMAVPETLKERLELFKAHARYFKISHEELFVEESWIQVLIGQGLRIEGYDPNVDIVPEDKIKAYLLEMEAVIDRCARALPTHREYVDKYCKAAPPIAM